MKVMVKGALVVLLVSFAPSLLTSCSTTGGGYNLGPTENVAGAVGGLTLEDGVPSGGWMSFEKRNFGSFSATINSTLSINADGVGTQEVGYVLYWNPGTACSSGVFAGQKRVAWATQQKLKTIKREGDKIYVYVDPSSRARLTVSSPTGQPLGAYQSLGGTLLGGFRSPLEEVGVSVFEISGKNLVLVSAPDRVHRTFQRQSFRR
jgi:hypothetical protein